VFGAGRCSNQPPAEQAITWADDYTWTLDGFNEDCEQIVGAQNPH